jgi:hypothetical protein
MTRESSNKYASLVGSSARANVSNTNAVVRHREADFIGFDY